MINYENINLNYILDTAEKLEISLRQVTTKKEAIDIKLGYIKNMSAELNKTSGKLNFEEIEKGFSFVLTNLINLKLHE